MRENIRDLKDIGGGVSDLSQLMGKGKGWEGTALPTTGAKD
jgi:hypothetical protein